MLDREALRYWRLQRGFTQQSLARQRAQLDGQTVQISYAQIRRVETDGRAGPATARTLAALLGLELAQLCPRDPRRMPCGLPREVSVDFVGRGAELEAVLAALGREGNVRIAASVEGLPGVGKTELALQVCGVCERTRAFRVFWLSAEQPDLTPVWGDVVARHLGIEHAEQRERARLALRAVEALAEPTLLVLDNVERWSASEPWPRPQGRHIRWLVTTRASGLGDRAFEHVSVPVLDHASAAELLLRIAGPDIAEGPGFAELVRHLDGYTIAVELAGAFLSRFPEVTPAEYLETLAAGKSDLVEGEVRERTLYQETLDGALELLWRRLPASVRAHWQLAACFAQDPASLPLSDACGLGRRARAELRDFHLIHAEARGWSMHRLVRAFARRRSAPHALEQGRAALARGCVQRLKAGAIEAYVPDRAHLDLALELAAALFPDDESQLAELRLGIGQARERTGSLPDPQPLLRQAVSFYRARVSACSAARDALEYARAQRDLGAALCMQLTLTAEPEPLREAVQACEAAVASFDRERVPLEWAGAQRLLGRALEGVAARSGEILLLERAIAAHRAALQVYTRTGAPLDWARTQRELGSVLLELAERSAALEPLQEAVDASRAALAALPPDTPALERASVQHALAGALHTLSDRTGDVTLGEEAALGCHAVLEIRTRSATPLLWAHIQTLLGLVHQSLASIAQSEAHAQAAAEVFGSILEAYDRETWTALPWADLMCARGVALHTLGCMQASPAVLEESVRCLRTATEAHSSELWSDPSAIMQSQLGLTESQLAGLRGDSPAAERGVALCRAAQAELARAGDALVQAAGQRHLGEALVALGRLTRDTEPLREALRCFLRAAEVYDAARFPRFARELRAQLAELEAAGARA